MKIDFLIVCKPEEADTDFLRDFVTDALVGTDDEDSQFELRLTLARPMPSSTTSDSQIICGFTVQFIDDLVYPIETVQAIITMLKGQQERHVLKFYDDALLEANIQHYREVFELEMKLRKAISLVYLAVCDGLYYELLRDDETQIIKKDEEKPKPGDFEAFSENEFFHLVFSQYIKLNQRRKPKRVDELLSMVMNATSYDAFRDEITRQPIQDEKDRGFLASLTTLLDPVEKLRNTVAHNRSQSNKLRANYAQAKLKLSEALEEFLTAFDPSANDGNGSASSGT